MQFEDLLNNNKLFVLPKNQVQLASEVVTVSQQFDNRSTPSKVKEIQQIGLLIRDAVLSSNTEMSWPPRPSELCENAVNLPPELDAFLCTLLTGNTDITTEYPHGVRKTETPKINTVTLRRKKTLSNNVELIQMLNRCGHGITYSKIEEINIALCIEKNGLDA